MIIERRPDSPAVNRTFGTQRISVTSAGKKAPFQSWCFPNNTSCRPSTRLRVLSVGVGCVRAGRTATAGTIGGDQSGGGAGQLDGATWILILVWNLYSASLGLARFYFDGSEPPKGLRSLIGNTFRNFGTFEYSTNPTRACRESKLEFFKPWP